MILRGWVVVVTFGNAAPNAVFARTNTEESANTLRRLAIERGYSDATVYAEAEFREIQAEIRRVQADKARARRKAS